jgi:septal ring factor EnvC (AmiA/AmiB activator)
MAREPEDVVVRILRQIQATQAEHSKQFVRMDERFERLEQQVGELNDDMMAALGLASHVNVREQNIQKEINDIKKRLKRLEAKR